MSIWKIRRPFRLLPALLAVCLLAGCGMADRGGQSAAQSVSSASSESGTLAQPEDFLPQNLAYGERPPASDLEDAKGNAVSLTDAYSGVPVWIVFFASWCPDCDGQLDSASRMQRIADEEGARLVFIDRLSPDRESVNAAEKKLDEKGVTWSPSPSKEAGKAWSLPRSRSGMKTAPTFLPALSMSTAHLPVSPETCTALKQNGTTWNLRTDRS